jgi:hypothetical protein
MSNQASGKAEDDELFESLLAGILGADWHSVRGLGCITPHDFVLDAITMLKQDDEQLVRLLAEQIAGGESETLIREYSFFLRRTDEPDLKRAMRLVQSIRMSNVPWSADYSKADARSQSQCVALMKVVSAVDLITDGKTTSLHYSTPQHSVLTRHWLIPVLKDEEMEGFILQHPEEAPRLIEVMRSCGVTEFGLLRAVLDGVTPSLASGAL